MQAILIITFVHHGMAHSHVEECASWQTAHRAKERLLAELPNSLDAHVVVLRKPQGFQSAA